VPTLGVCCHERDDQEARGADIGGSREIPRLPKDTVVRQAAQGTIPGRQIEDTWRFLKTAIDEWLRSYDSRTLLLQQAGALTEDESLPALLKTIYATRKRPEAATRRS